MKGWREKCQSFNKGLPWSLGLISRFGNLGIKPTVEVYSHSLQAEWLCFRLSGEQDLVPHQGLGPGLFSLGPKMKGQQLPRGNSLHLYGIKGLGPLYEHISSLCLQHACYHPTGLGKSDSQAWQGTAKYSHQPKAKSKSGDKLHISGVGSEIFAWTADLFWTAI